VLPLFFSIFKKERHILMKQKVVLILVLLAQALRGLSQSNAIDSLTKLLNAAREDTNKVQLYNQLAPKVFGNDPARALDYANTAFQLATKLDYQRGIALSLKNIGLIYYLRDIYDSAITYSSQSLEVLNQVRDDKLKVVVLSNIGASYFEMADDSKAIDFYLQALKVSEAIKDTFWISMLYSNIGAVYFRKPSTHDKALDYYLKAMPLMSISSSNEANGTISVNLAEIYVEKGEDSLALAYFDKSLKYLQNTESLPYPLNSLGAFYSRHKNYAKSLEYHQKALEIATPLELKSYMIVALMGIGDAYMQTGQLQLAIRAYKRAEQLANETKAEDKLKESYKRLASSFATTSNYKQAYEYQLLLTRIQDKLYNDSATQKINNLQFDFEMQKKQGEINLLTKVKALQELDLQRQKVVTNSLIVVVLLVFAIGVIIYRNYRAKVETNKILDSQKAEIESLLLNILPAEVAEELQRNGSSTPRYYESASVLFTDFKSFTILADKFSPQALVAELNETFIAFDAIMQKYGLEKIKTIGDAYMCAGGIPTANSTHPVDIIKASFEIITWMEGANQKRLVKGEEPWYLRIGIHTGPIVAGVVGKSKYAYDIWGSTVNVASRMESNGEPGHVNISAATYELVKDHFACTYRGKIYAKNVGEIDMYFVDHAIQDGSILNTARIVNSSLM